MTHEEEEEEEEKGGKCDQKRDFFFSRCFLLDVWKRGRLGGEGKEIKWRVKGSIRRCLKGEKRENNGAFLLYHYGRPLVNLRVKDVDFTSPFFAQFF